MSEYLRANEVLIKPDGTATPRFLRWLNSRVDQLGGQGRDTIQETSGAVETVTAAAENLEAGQAALDTAVTAAQAAAQAASTAAGEVATQVAAVDATVADLNTNVIPQINTRLDNLESQP